MMFKHSYQFRVGLTTPWLMLCALAFGPAAPSAMAAGGVVVLPNGGADATCSSAALASDGKIAVTGYTGNSLSPRDTLAASLLPSGDLNTGFGGGIVVTGVAAGNDRDVSRACAVQSDGKVLSGGWFRYSGIRGLALVRYNANGTLDKTFNKSGIVRTKLAEDATIYAMVMQGDKILVTGRYGNSTVRVITARYTKDGKLDSTFGSGGIFLDSGAFEGRSIALQGNGKIIVGARAAGMDNKLIRYSSNGTPDTSFGGLGIASFAPAEFEDTELHGLAVDSQDRIVVAGESSNWAGGYQRFLTLARFTPNGALDSTFGNGQGYITFRPEPDADFDASSVALDNNGRIVAAGSRQDILGQTILVARFLNDGTVDRDFNRGPNGEDGGYTADYPEVAEAVLVQPDGNIVVAGSRGPVGGETTTAIVVLRYRDDGTLDPDF